MLVSTNKKKYIYDFENADDNDNELNQEGDNIELNNKSLKNTNIEKVQKEVLPMADIIKDILKKDLSERKYTVSSFMFNYIGCPIQ